MASELGLFSRAVIIFYGFGIASIGIHAMENKYGGTANYISSKSQEVLNRNWIPENWKNPEGLKVAVAPKGEEARIEKDKKIGIPPEQIQKDNQALKDFFSKLKTKIAPKNNSEEKQSKKDAEE